MKKYQLIKTKLFLRWLQKQPEIVISRIDARLVRIEEGNFGDHKWFGDIGELRLHFGKGYRLYYTTRHQEVVLLLLGGDKSSQENDIKTARMMLKQLNMKE